ncbi:MAG: hypothetical protein K0Q55_2770, partial [Verrucomicrobia bacterium]|nr:hypothetical protein [Verrucomicrobiota bacterium]
EALRLQIAKDTAVPSALYSQQLNKAARLIEALAFFEADQPDIRPVILTLKHAVNVFYSENGNRGPAQQLILQDLKKLEELSSVH